MSEPLLFPMFLRLAGRRVVVIGAGMLAQSKIESLLRAGAAIVVIAPEATAQVQALAAAGRLLWIARPFTSADLAGAFLAIAATDSPEINQAVFDECRRRGVLCNAVDDPEHCDFFYGAVARRGPLQIAISTGGASPALARRLREELEEQFGPEYEPWLAHVGETRRKILAGDVPPDRKQAELEHLVSRESFEEFIRKRMKTRP